MNGEKNEMKKKCENDQMKEQKPEKRVLYWPAVFGHFLDPPGNHPRGAIFPTVDPSH